MYIFFGEFFFNFGHNLKVLFFNISKFKKKPTEQFSQNRKLQISKKRILQVIPLIFSVCIVPLSIPN